MLACVLASCQDSTSTSCCQDSTGAAFHDLLCSSAKFGALASTETKGPQDQGSIVVDLSASSRSQDVSRVRGDSIQPQEESKFEFEWSEDLDGGTTTSLLVGHPCGYLLPSLVMDIAEFFTPEDTAHEAVAGAVPQPISANNPPAADGSPSMRPKASRLVVNIVNLHFICVEDVCGIRVCISMDQHIT